MQYPFKPVKCIENHSTIISINLYNYRFSLLIYLKCLTSLTSDTTLCICQTWDMYKQDTGLCPVAAEFLVFSPFYVGLTICLSLFVHP